MDVDGMKAEQRRLADRVRLEDDLRLPPRRLAAFDVAYDGDVGVGALVLADGDGAPRVDAGARVCAVLSEASAEQGLAVAGNVVEPTGAGHALAERSTVWTPDVSRPHPG